MSRRGLAAVAILILWVAGLGFLVRREVFRPDTERFAELGLRVNPGATYYAVTREGRHIGFASTTIDTTETGIQIVDYLVADLPTGDRTHRATARTRIRLSRAMRVRDFHVQIEADQGPVTATGEMDGDSVITVVVQTDPAAPADTHRVPVTGPVLLPTMIPLAVALEKHPAVGETHRLPVFDPVASALKSATVRIAAESLFVIHDSSTYDAAAGRWEPLLPDTVRAWQLVHGDTGTVAGWVDAQGRLVRGTQLGLTLERMPYELAFENWQSGKRERADPAVPDDEDILEATVIAAGVRADRALDEMRVTLRGVDLVGFDLASERQSVRGDTVYVVREGRAAMTPQYRLGGIMRSIEDHAARVAMRKHLQAEPLVEAMDPDIRDLAARLRRGERDPRIVAERIHRWVRDSLAKRPTFGVPSARAVLAARAGDANEHTQLYVALARAASLPARVAAGLVHLDGKFYYHAWPEIYLGDWVAVDPTLDQFPADAAHLRFVVGGLDRQAELLRLMGTLDIDVLEAR